METPAHQEERARQRVDNWAVVKTALLVGFVLFIMSGGGPWSTAGTMNVIVGRDVSLPWPWLLLGHFALSLLYVYILAHVLYRFRLGMALVSGVLTMLVLYGINLLLFRGLGMTQYSPESKTAFVHVVFGVFASLLYKAFSVPKPIEHGPASK